MRRQGGLDGKGWRGAGSRANAGWAVWKRIAAGKSERPSFGRTSEGNARADDGNAGADRQSRSLDALRIHPDRILIVIREIAVRNCGVRKEMSEMSAGVRVSVPVDNRMRMILISLVRVQHGRDASQHECRDDDAGDKRRPRELHVKPGLWWQCERCVKQPA